MFSYLKDFFGLFQKSLKRVLFLLYKYFIYTFKLPIYVDMDSMWGPVNSNEDLFQVKCMNLPYVRVCDKKL